MKYNSQICRRKSIRIKNYDYSQNGAYFVTICAQNRACLFGKIKKGKMILNNFGKIAHRELQKTAEIRKNVSVFCFVVMPNHIHAVFVIDNGDNNCTGTDNNCTGTARRAPTREQFGKPTKNSIPTIVRGYKSAVTKHINELRKTPKSPVWQRNYHEHIIRNEKTFAMICDYIFHNPEKWRDDKFFSL